MYKVPVKIEGIERRKRSTGTLHVIAGLFLIANGGTYYRLTNYNEHLLVFLIYAAAACSFIYGLFRKKLDPAAKYNHWVRLIEFITFSMLGLAMINFGKPLTYFSLFLWSIITLFLMFTERKVFHDTVMQIKEDGIHIPGYFTHHVIPWSVVQGFVLRPDYVTITRTNLKYVQLELLAHVDLEEQERINQYCSNKLNKQG